MDKEKLDQAAKASTSKPDPSTASRMRKRVQVTEQSEAAKTLVRYLGSTSVAGLSIIAAAKAGLGLMLEKGLDHKLEFEADQEGVKYAVAAGYDPKALSNFLGRLVARQKILNTKTLEKTHPKPAERRARVDQLLAQMKADTITGAKGVERFAAMQQRMPVAAKAKTAEKKAKTEAVKGK